MGATKGVIGRAKPVVCPSRPVVQSRSSMTIQHVKTLFNEERTKLYAAMSLQKDEMENDETSI
jgi:hypothetical protein